MSEVPSKRAHSLPYRTLLVFVLSVLLLSALLLSALSGLGFACQFRRPPLCGLSITFSHRSSEMQLPQQSHGEQPTSDDPPLHPEIRSIVSLTSAHTIKIYFSGFLVHKLDRNPDGNKPHKDEGWREVWAQLSGTTLCIWDMEEVKIANHQGREVPPSYISVEDVVRPFFHLYYLHESTIPPSSVRSGPRCHNTASDADVPPSQVH